MAACAFCGATLAPGATFCRACGAAAVAPYAPPTQRARRPSRAAALTIATLPVTAIVFVVAMMATDPFSSFRFQASLLLLPAAIALVALPIAWAVWKGTRWGSAIAIVAALAWGGFTAWAAFDTLQIVQSGVVSFARSQMVSAMVFAFAQAIACVIALALLVRELRRRYRQSRTI